MLSDLVLYKDKDLTKPFTMVDLGDVDPPEVVTKVGYLSNNTHNEIFDIDYETNDPDITIENLPNTLASDQWLPILLVFSPPNHRTEPLFSPISITGKLRGG